MGYWVDLDPGPILILAADQQATDNFKIERIEPLIANTPAVHRHRTGRAWDETKYRIRFDTCWLFLTWAGSKSGTKTRPIRYLVCEEPDEFPAFSSSGGDPLAKAMKRTTTYADKGQARILIGGTPTTRRGNTWKRWALCALRYHLWLPCPHCRGYQLLRWKQVRWPELHDEPDRAKRAERIKAEGLAHYECEHCKQPIRDHHKPAMLRAGRWANEDQAVSFDGRVVGPERLASRVGVKISSLYSPWVPFAKLAAEWIEAQGNPDALCDFINQFLAETWEEERAKVEPDAIRAKVQRPSAIAPGGWEPLDGSPKPLLVPAWARTLIAAADTQGTCEQDGHFWYVIRAWSYEFRSQLVDFGVCHSKVELVQRCLDRPIRHEKGYDVMPNVLLIDSGGKRWSEIYQLAQADNRIHPTKGANTRRDWMVEERLQKRHAVVLWLIDTEQSKDLLHRLINDPDRTRWMPHNGINADFCRQMASEAKVFDPVEKCEKWVEIIQDGNHIWDCEAQQAAGAWKFGLGMPAPEEPPPSPPPPPVERPGWLPERPEKWLK